MSDNVSQPYPGGVELRFVRDGACWRKLGFQRGVQRLDDGLVDLEHVLSVVGRDGFSREHARRLDPVGAERLDRRIAVTAS
jgi:hypothetical protein